MLWTPQQDTALTAVRDWLRDPNGQQVFRLFGYAGTGKTEMAKALAESYNVAFCAYTGKAASVMRQRGCHDATTIHSLIYRPIGDQRALLARLEAELATLQADPDTPDQQLEELSIKIASVRKDARKPLFELKPLELSDLEGKDLVIMDECSMVDERLAMDLLSYGFRVLVLGDPAQLPPVKGLGFFTAREPDILLTEIHRQARDNPIIAMATAVRNKIALDIGNYGESRVVESVSPEEALTYSQILCGKNATRHSINQRVRELMELAPGMPQVGDRLVCLKNHHPSGLLNGTLWDLVAIGTIRDGELEITVREADGEKVIDCVTMDHFLRYKPGEPGMWDGAGKQEFDYGYALTVHKAQGSQWPNLLLYDESWVFRTDRWKWLYTGITRAQQTITIVR